MTIEMCSSLFLKVLEVFVRMIRTVIESCNIKYAGVSDGRQLNLTIPLYETIYWIRQAWKRFQHHS